MARCTDLGNGRWSASLPALTDIKTTKLPFRVEVVTDEYFFTPARGEIVLVTVKDVEFPTPTKKPKVSASFKVSQEEVSNKTTVKEDSRYIAGETSPTTTLLSPESDPSVDQSVDVENPGMFDVTPDEEILPDEEENDLTYSASITIVQTPDNTTSTISEFDPKQVAADIIKRKMGSISRPASPGKLFNRTSKGQAVIAGLETPTTKQQLTDKEAKVREILNSV